ncbi:MAG TPA: ABC transporter substrate-binding protein [Acidocella sp.]|nr:ABC transporter substrate-binding protein [Acidocella sp.]
MLNKLLRAGLLGASALAASALPALAGKPQIVIGYENNGADPYMVTQGLGLFQKTMDADVTLKFFDSGPAAMSALASNSLQFMCGLGVPPFVAAISQGLPLAIIYNQERYTTAAGIAVRPGAGIHAIADLKGKKIAIVQGSQASFELATFLQEASVPFESVTQVNMSPPEMRVAYTTNSIDAAIVWAPVFDALQEAGARVLKTDADLPRDASSYNVCIANTNWVKDHPQLTVQFIKALDQGVTYTKENPAKALTLMATQAGIDAATAAAELKGYEIFSAKDQSAPFVLGAGDGVANSATTKTLANTATVLLKIGRITSPLSAPAKAVEPTFAIDAAK